MPTHKKWCVIASVNILSVIVLSGCNSLTQLQITPATVFLSAGQQQQFTVVTNGLSSARYVWQVNGVTGGSPSIGTITSDGIYTAPSTPSSQLMHISVLNGSSGAIVSIFDPNHPPVGTVTATQNPLVAAYAISLPVGATAQVEFGPDTGYGLSTSAVTSSAQGGDTTVLVAGMRSSTTYHMRARVTLSSGSQFTDSDHSFVTGAIPADRLPNIATQLSGIGTPNPGIELLSLYPFSSAPPSNALWAVATDLAGNVIWYYDLPPSTIPFPIKQLPNGHMLLVTVPYAAGGISDIREIDLAGNLIHQVTLGTISRSLATAAPFQINSLSHDVLALPNGHLILLANTIQTINGVSGIPTGTHVLGDVLIDWDMQKGAVWTWSAFDHLDLSHAPYGISDWTHANAVIYSPDDGNLILSMRNQNWVVKIDYRDGVGDGTVLWRFGPDGDFVLPAQQAPIEWNYGQHYATIQSPNSSGIFSLMFFNNGNNRLMDSNNDVCGSPGVGTCYSSVPIFQLNEYDKTATLVWEDNLNPVYSICCGDALILPNGNVEFDAAFDVNNPNVSSIEEVTQTQAPELVWRMDIQGQLAYRGMRIPSLYPGQVWPAITQATASQSKVQR